MNALILLLGLLLSGFLLWWLVFETEGVYLGKRTVILLYDLYAKRYDRIKQFDEQADILLLSAPLLERIHPQRNPLILDIATGTGRLPLIMARNARFGGHVVAIDLSQKMLDVATEKVMDQHFEEFVTLLQHDAMNLPFADECFDIVTCLEALEFLPDPEAALQEMIRVLRPAGLLLSTLRIDTRWMPDRTFSRAEMERILRSFGMCENRV